MDGTDRHRVPRHAGRAVSLLDARDGDRRAALARVLLDGALTRTFGETRALLIGVAWLATLTLV